MGEGTLWTGPRPLATPLPPKTGIVVDVWATLLSWHQSGRHILPIESGSRSPALPASLALGTAPIQRAAAAYTLGDRTIALARIPQGADIHISADRTLCISDRADGNTYVVHDGLADWAAGRIDEVMTDHSTSHFGREINDQVKAVAAKL